MQPAREVLTVRKRKFDGSIKYEWPGERFETGKGEWIAVHHRPRRYQKRMTDGSVVDSDESHLIHYACLDQPLTVIFAYSLDGEFLDAKCDAALPARLEDGYLDFVDLDLDVVVLPGLQHYIRDQEVFAERSVSMGYSDEAKRAAHFGVLHALRLVRRRQFPFDGHPEGFIASVLGGTESGN